MLLSFSRRPACYNTDTVESLKKVVKSVVSVEDLHVIILIPLRKNDTTQQLEVSVENLHVIILILFIVCT